MAKPTKFTHPIICEIANDGKSYTLQVPFAYYRKDNPQELIIVPRGFKSDGFTNFGFHSFIPKYGKGLKCAILHDYLCEQFHKGKITRIEADSLFLESLLETKAFSKPKCYVLYGAVRLYALLKKYK